MLLSREFYLFVAGLHFAMGAVLGTLSALIYSLVRATRFAYIKGVVLGGMAWIFATFILSAWLEGYGLPLAQVGASVLAGLLAASWSPIPKGRPLRD